MLYTLTNSLINLRIKRFKWECIDIETINYCNLNCIMCPYENMKREKAIMNMELYKKIVDDAVSFGIKKATLTNYGEPLLDSLIIERIKYAKEKGMEIGFFTNGTILNDEISKKIIESGLDWIYFSFDGATKETYEKIRRGANFDRVQKNIKSFIEYRNKFRTSKPAIIIGMTLQEENKKDAKDFIKLWKNIADKVFVSNVDNRKYKNNFYGKVYPCARLLTRVVVLVDGRVALCCKDFNGDFILGDLKHESLKDVWISSERIRRLHLERRGDLIPLCAGCDDIRRPGIWWSIILGDFYLLLRPVAERVYKFAVRR